MDKYIFLAHTADFKFKAFGESLEEAFVNSVLALTDIVVEQKDVEPVRQREISVVSESKESLLYDFLEKILLMIDTDHFIIASVDSLMIEKKQDYELKATVSGDLGIEKYGYKRAIKAITYNDMVIDEKPNNVTIQVVVDL